MMTTGLTVHGKKVCRRCYRSVLKEDLVCGRCRGALLGALDRMGYLQWVPEIIYVGKPRSDDYKEEWYYEPSPWQENAIRELEECR